MTPHSGCFKPKRALWYIYIIYIYINMLMISSFSMFQFNLSRPLLDLDLGLALHVSPLTYWDSDRAWPICRGGCQTKPSTTMTGVVTFQSATCLSPSKKDRKIHGSMMSMFVKINGAYWALNLFMWGLPRHKDLRAKAPKCLGRWQWSMHQLTHAWINMQT